MRSILTSHMIVDKICFHAIWMTFICDLKIDLIMFEPHHRSTSDKKDPIRKSKIS